MFFSGYPSYIGVSSLALLLVLSSVFNSSLFHILHDGLAPELLTGIGKTGRVGGPFLLITNLFAVLSKSSWLFLFNGIVLSTEGW